MLKTFSQSRGSGGSSGNERLPPRPGKLPELLFAELWAKRYPNAPLPPLPPFLLSVFSEQTAERLFIRCILPVLKLEQWKDNLYVNQLFLSGLFFAVAGYSTTFRAYYKDQFWYGLRSSLPGIAQVQPQQFTTFQYFTAPTGVELARQLGTVMSTADHYENPAMQFLETPFVNRLDLYPHAAVLHLTPQWTTLIGENYTTALPLYLRKYHRMLRRLRHRFDYRQRAESRHSIHHRKRRLFGRGTIPIFQTLSTFHPLEYKPRRLAHSLDSWANQRFFFDLADEVPTRLQDSFGFDPTYSPTPFTIPVTSGQGNTANPLFVKHSPERLTEDLAAVNLELLQFQTETVKGGEALDNFEATEASMIYGIPFPRSHRASRRASKSKTKTETKTETKVSSTSALSDGADESVTESVTGEDIVHVLDFLSSPVSEEEPISSSFPYMDNYLGYSPEHAISQSSWILDLAGLEPDELAWLWTWDQRPRMKAPKTPVIYPYYKLHRYKSGVTGNELTSPTRIEDQSLRSLQSQSNRRQPLRRQRLQRGRRRRLQGRLRGHQAFRDSLRFRLQASIWALSMKVESISKKVSGKVLTKPKALLSKFVDPSLVARFPSLRRRQVAKAIKEGMAVSLKRQKLQGHLNSFSGYSRARRAYSLHKGMMKDVNRIDAPLRETANELNHFWEKEFPSFLLDYINHAPVVKYHRSWLPIPHESEILMRDFMPGALDWYAHRPMARQDWHQIMMSHFYDLVSTSPELLLRKYLAHMRFNFATGISPTDFTVTDVRIFLRTLFGTDFKTPHSFLQDEIRNRIQFLLDHITDRDPNTDLDTVDDAWSYKQLYEVLATKGLSTGPLSPTEPMAPTDPTAPMDDGSCPLPSGLRMSIIQHPNTSFLDEPVFYSPIIDWLEGDFFSHGDASRLPLPKGLEFHWAIHANHLATCDMTPNAFIDALTGRDYPNYVPKGRHYRHLLQTHPSKTMAENMLCTKRAEQLRRLLKEQTGAYIHALESAGLSKQAHRLGKIRALDFLRTLQGIVNYRRLYNELVGLVQEATSMRSLSFKSVRSNWYRHQPEMTGFLFPDETDCPTMMQKVQSLHRLGSKSLWEAFQAMTSLRPLEIFLPPGYRLFASQTMPDFTRPRPLPYQDVPTFPLYEVDRHPLQLPGYQELKTSYSDLDVSFFPSPPQPEVLRRHVFADPPLSLEKPEKPEKPEKAEKAEDQKENEKKEEDKEELKEDWMNPEWKAQLEKVSDYPDNMRIQDIGRPYPDYFNYSTTLAMQDGELDISDNLLHWIHHYYLGAQNWLKDVPANFFGKAGGTYGEHLPNFRRKIAFEQMRPLFIIPDGPYMRDTMQEIRLRIAGAPSTRLPSQLEDGNGLWFLLDPSPRVRARHLIRQIRKQYFLKTRPPSEGQEKNLLLHNEVRNHFKYPPPFKVNSINSLPELSRDEWYRLFHLAIERVRRTGDPQIYLDIPAIRPVIYNRPVSFAGRIHVDPLVLDQKRRTQTLAQILFAASQSYDGGVDIPDYLNPRQFSQVNPSPMSGESRHVLPICWHYVISKSPISTLLDIPTVPLNRVSTQTFFPHRFQRRVARRHIPVAFDHLLQAENFLRTGDVTKAPSSDSLRRLIGGFHNFLVYETRGFQHGTKKKRLRYLEPLSPHSWFILFQVFVLFAFVQYCKTLAFFIIRNVYLEAHYKLFPIFQFSVIRKRYPKLLSNMALSVQATYEKMGLVPSQTFRVFRDVPRRFTDIVGMEVDVLLRSADIVVTLQNRGRGGPTASKGVLLYGPPGNGKTFLVQAIAGEAHVPLITVTTAELFNKERHETPAKGLLKAFSLSYRLRPSILFIDEIDGLGLQRSALLRQEGGESPNPGRNLVAFMNKVPPQLALPLVSEDAVYQDPAQAQSERRKRSIEGIIDDKRLSFETEDKKFVSDFPFEGYFGPNPPESTKALTEAEIEQVAVLTTFLVAMDIIRPSYGMVVIGATNRLSLIDPAIIRDGRLDRHIGINAPSEDRRVEMMRFYLGRLGLQEELQWDYLADRTRDYSVADLIAMINLSAMTAILRNEKHTLASVEEALAATIRYRAIRADILPFPSVHQLPKGDPLFFLRVSYYQASRALIHNILPDHPRLPFVQMQIEPFLPDLPIENLLKRAYTLQDLIDRLAAMVSGKAGEYLLLYGAPFASQYELNERQLWESTLGSPELAYAVDLAYAIADQWLLLDDVTVPLRKLLKLAADDNDDLFFEPGGDVGIPHFLRYNLEHITKQHSRLAKLSTSMNDETVRIYSYFTNTVRWFAYTKSTFNFIPEEFNYWKPALSKNPLKRNVSEPIEQYYSDRPYFKILEPLVCKDPSSQSDSQSDVDEDMTKVCPRPTLPDLELIDRDYLMFAILVKTFNNVVEILTQHRPIVDRMSKHLRQNQVLRSPEIFKYIREYTAELRAAVPETPVRRDPQKGEIVDLSQGPQSRIHDINGRKQIVIDQSWGIDSRKPIGRSIPINVATDGPTSPVWSSQSLDQQNGKDGKRQRQSSIDYLAATDMEFQSYKDWYAERYRRIYDYFAEEIAQHEAETNERRDAYVGEALISLVPGMQSYLDRLERQLQIEEDWGPAPDQEGDLW